MNVKMAKVERLRDCSHRGIVNETNAGPSSAALDRESQFSL